MTDILSSGICILAMTVVMLGYMESVSLVNQKAAVGQLARKYILRMETVGYLTERDYTLLCQELETIGVSETDLTGTTRMRLRMVRRLHYKLAENWRESIHLKRGEFQRQRINQREREMLWEQAVKNNQLRQNAMGQRMARRSCARRKGSIEWVTGLFFLLFLMFFLLAEVQLSAYRATSLYLEDALAVSNLASAVIDIEEYGISHTVRIADPKAAYARYVEAVKKNLNLDENWECANSALISGKVSIADYIIYNVEEDAVVISRVSEDGSVHSWQGVPGRVNAPNGVAVETTGIYSELSFPVEGLLGVTVQAQKGKLVDIAADQEGTA